MRTVTSRVLGCCALAAVVGLVAAAPAGAVVVKGTQVATTGTKSKMKGDLLGTLKVTRFHLLRDHPVIKFRGRERFEGCIDSDRDRSCEGEVSGKLFFKFRYWLALSDDDELQLGTCAHRVTGGEGGFAGASGFLQMIDVPARNLQGVKTKYEGDVNLGLGAREEVGPAC